MENIQSRKGALAAAITDIALTLISLAFVIVFVINYKEELVEHLKIKLTESQDLPEEESEKVVATAFWTVTILYGIGVVIILWDDVNLIKATRQNADLATSLKRAKFWLGLTVFFLVLRFASLIYLQPAYVANVLLHEVSLYYLVQIFINELKTAIELN